MIGTTKDLHNIGALGAAMALLDGGTRIDGDFGNTRRIGRGVFNISKAIARAEYQARVYASTTAFSRALNRGPAPQGGYRAWTQTTTQRQRSENPVYPKWMTRWWPEGATSPQ